ncbi:LCP family protein, partial [Kibdelosporangium lantanae]
PNQPVPATQENILLVGLDNGFADNGQSNADTIVLVRHNADGSFHALSLPRDSYVDIPGFGMHKLNSAYARGAAGKNAEEGRKLLVKTVQNLTGVKVDHYAFVNQADFGKVANAVGGVEVCLKNAVKDQFSNADFPAGKQVLTGDKVLPAFWNVGTDRATRADYVPLPPEGIVIIDGELLLGRGLPFDLTVHLWMSTPALTRRTPTEDAWSLPAYERYEHEVNPLTTADIAVRVDDPNHPALKE